MEPAAARQPAPLAPTRVLPRGLDAYLHWQNGLCRPETRILLELAPTPWRAARLSLAQLRSALKRAYRQRRIDADAERIREVLLAEYAHQPPLVEDALGKQMLALLRQLDAACTAADQLAEAVEEAFPQHPDAEIILSLPRLGTQLGARILAEIGDDHARFATARGMKAYAGASPITRASGKKSSITRRWVKNDRLNHMRLPVGLRLTDPLTGRKGPLRPPPRGRGLARRRSEKPLQQDDRPALPLPPEAHPVRREPRLPHTTSRSCLTTWLREVSWRSGSRGTPPIRHQR